MKILLVRHGQSEANANKDLHYTMADHAIPLSELGVKQAREAGKFLGTYLDNIVGIPAVKPLIRLWLSPYERTRRTASNIMMGINDTAKSGKHSTFKMDKRESIRLCEQQFGLFDGIPDDERHIKYPDEADHYQKCEDQNGHFWARMPLGESRFDVANRVHETFGTFHRDNEKHGINTIVVVCHGVTLRAFVMEWLHLTPEWFNDEPNPGNCDIRLIENNKDEGYIHRGKIDE